MMGFPMHVGLMSDMLFLCGLTRLGTVMHDWFGVTSKRVAPLIQFARKLGLQGSEATVDGMIAYANTHKPANATPDDICQEMVTLFGELTRPSPEVFNKSGRVPAIACNSSINSVGQIVEEYWKQCPKRRGEFTKETGVNILKRHMRAHNLDFMVQPSDHNCCPHCEELKATILDSHSCAQHLENTRRPADQDEAQKYRVLESNAQNMLEQHYQDDRHVRSFISVLEMMFVRVEQELAGEGVDTKTTRHPYASLPTGTIIHVDDKTAFQWPKLRRDCGSTLHKNKTDSTGCFCMMQSRIFNFFGEPGTTNKDSDTIICAILLMLLERLNGQKIVVLLLDNCKINKNSNVAMKLTQWITDLGLADCVIVVFFMQYHGKWWADMRFGVQELKFRESTVLSMGDLMEVCSDIRSHETGLPDQCRAVNPAAMARFGDYFDGMYSSAADSCIEIDIDDHHLFTAGGNPSHLRDGIRTCVIDMKMEVPDPFQMPDADGERALVSISLADIIAKVAVGRTGWVKSMKLPCHWNAPAPQTREVLMHLQTRKCSLP